MRSVAAGTPPRPLYLSARARLRVEAGGESLVVRLEPAGMQRFPVSRVDRVVCGRGAAWSGEALVLALKRGVTITWVDATGSPVGEAMPRLAHPSTLDAALGRFLERPQWAVSYGHWLRRRRLAIAIKRRLSRLHRFLTGRATPVQYSVFCFHGNAMQLGTLMARMEDFIDPRADDVRVYQLPEQLRFDVLGRGILPDGVLLPSVPVHPAGLLFVRGNDCYDGARTTEEEVSVVEVA